MDRTNTKRIKAERTKTERTKTERTKTEKTKTGRTKTERFEFDGNIIKDVDEFLNTPVSCQDSAFSRHPVPVFIH